MAHDEDEGEPGHVRGPPEEEGDGVGADRGDEDRAQAGPQVEEADQVEDADADDEEVLVGGAGVGDALEEAGERVGEEEGEDELDWAGGMLVECCQLRPRSTYARPAQLPPCSPHRRMLKRKSV